MALRNLKINYYGFFGFLGFYGFAEPIFFLFFLFFLFFIVDTKGKPASVASFGVAQQEQKKEHLQKIIEFMAGKDQIANNEVQNLLDISDATAERYLNELEKQGILKQSGNTGKYVFYSKV